MEWSSFKNAKKGVPGPSGKSKSSSMMISTLEGKVTDFPFTTFTTKKQYKLNKIKNDFIVSLVLNVTKIAI